MKKIIIDNRESGTSTGRYVDKLVEYLHKLQPEQAPDYAFTILAKPHRLEFLQAIAPNFIVVPTTFKEFTFAEQWGFKKQIEALQADLVHFPMVQQPVLYKRSPVVTTMQDLTTIRFRNPSKNPVVYTAKQQVYKVVNKYVARKSTAILTPSEFVKQDIMRYTGIPADKITVTLESSDAITDNPQAVSQLEGKQFIMYLGRPLPHKNLVRLIEAFRIVQKQFPDLWLALAGKKDILYQRIESDVKAQGISNVLFTDFISEGELRWMYEHCQAYTFPSLSEGFGLPALEAMRHGAPVVSSNATCSPEIYGDAALYFDPLNTTDMAQKIITMLSNDKLRQDFITRGYAQANKYSWERMARQTLSVYQSVLR
jgi:glycosyltransferase involved in cell wall biosynthesis